MLINGFFIGSLIDYSSYKICKEERGNLKEFCKYLKEIPLRRTILYALVAAVYYLLYLRYKLSMDFFKYYVTVPIFIVIAIVDLKTRNIYFITTFIAGVISILFIVMNYFNGIDIGSYILGGVGAGALSLLLAFIKVIGFGDVEIFLVCGLLMGGLNAVLIGIISVGICGIQALYLIITKKAEKNLRVAFAPYITTAFIAVIIFL